MQAEKMQAVIYCRVARADDTKLENQRRIMRGFAAAQGYEIYAEYFDNGVHGLSLDRPAFSQMNNDILAGKIQVVLVNCISRIGRDFIAVGKWFCKMQALGVKIIIRNGNTERPFEISSSSQKFAI